MNKKAVIFDMDGVIIDSEPLWQQAQIESLAGFGVAITHQDCEQLTMGKRIDEIARIWCHTYSLPVASENLENLILTNLCQRISVTGEAMTGVYDALKFFAEKGLKIALATSSNHLTIKAVFDRLHLWDKFNVVCSAEDEAYGKPHPDVYLTAARKLNLDTSDCLVIEDSFVGLTAAKSANMMTCIVCPNFEESKFSIADERYMNLDYLVKNYQNSSPHLTQMN
ncbi:HAD superfamily hydrolase (TIGR01509 family)/HAD superfamily hydrolase (TIGR01549 family) [Vibrio diazotrophicus]|uniref:HAD superfamily hydrolase (TIGR01509 family)/HAD superfamily hydrolase (TIGR01549 family) n=1 Tax=Vibrio diazotrophicus TaxID=685 RepID=A0A329E571_VIBDI|nr:hexitol phosphatase HxpB [Vibrio diazotrophicus]RAS59115.1 HAD superfamily hydrolase (TIGR01509 family)/HAD superfamily hydrolase (TIGR01549 family) [Vibrio diazotrophicus]